MPTSKKSIVRKANTISLDELIQVSTISAVDSLKTLELKDQRFKPRIWVGIYIEPFGSGELDIGNLRR